MAKKHAKKPATLPPDPEGMNDDRAGWAETALMAFMEETGSSETEEALADLLCDLQHLCDRKPETYGTWRTQLDRANSHYEFETMGEMCGKCGAVEGTPEYGTMGDGYDGMRPNCADAKAEA